MIDITIKELKRRLKQLRRLDKVTVLDIAHDLNLTTEAVYSFDSEIRDINLRYFASLNRISNYDIELNVLDQSEILKRPIHLINEKAQYRHDYIREQLVELRLDSGVTQKEIDQNSPLSRNNISHYESTYKSKSTNLTFIYRYLLGMGYQLEVLIKYKKKIVESYRLVEP